MPPRRSARTAAVAAPLQDCVIAVSGASPDNQTQSQTLAKIASLGASTSQSVTNKTTHLITTEHDFLAKTTKVKAATDKGTLIVDYQWLFECEAQGRRLPEKPYDFMAKATVAAKAVTRRGDQPPAKKVKTESVDGDVKTPNVPLDEACILGGYSVYISDGHIWDASLNQTNASNNNNKFYRLQVIHNAQGHFQTWTRWGRVGERGSTATLGDGTEAGAIRQFELKFKDKSGLAWADRMASPKPKKYTFIERSYQDESDDNEEHDDKWVPPECTLEEPVQQLMKLIFNQQYFAAAMSELNYDANKLPLGRLSQQTITRGFQALKDLSALLNDNSIVTNYPDMNVQQALEHLSNSYYSVIPHIFGRNRPPVIQEETLLKREVELLESLSDMKDASNIINNDDPVHPLTKMYNGLKLSEMTPLDRSDNEFRLLKDYLDGSRGQTHGHHYSVQDIFRIQRDSEKPFAPISSDRRLLWHGSRVTNFGGILSQGLRIAPPEAPVSGYMFGKGVYLADMSSKSANYCCSHISGGEALLLLCEADLGPMQALTNADYNAGDNAKAQGMSSTWGQGQTGPKAWKDAAVVHTSLEGVKMPDTSIKPGNTGLPGACLQYNEYIVYDLSQVRLRYLLRVMMR